MIKIKLRRCPSCGKAGVANIGGINYTCRYCGHTFVVKDEAVFSEPDLIQASGAKRIRTAPLLAFILVIVGIGLGVFVFTRYRKVKGEAFLNAWQKPGLEDYHCLAGSKGAVVWLVLRTQTNRLDSVKYFLRLIDPVTKQVIAEQPLGKTKPWKAVMGQSKLLDNEFYVYNDTVFNVSEEGGVQCFALYTGLRLADNESLEKRFPALKDGIAEAESEYSKKRIRLTSANGDNFYYYPESGDLLTEEEQGEKMGEGIFSEDIYLSQTKKAQLYLCILKKPSHEPFYIEERDIEAFANKSPYANSFIRSIRKISDTVYARAVPVQKYEDKLLFFYASDFSKKAEGQLGLINKDGQLSWKNKDTAFRKLLDKAPSETIHLRHTSNGTLIVITIAGDFYQSIGVNLKTGKTEFIFNQTLLIN